jgi:hypothetical protein
MADLSTLQIRLEEAETAYHKLMTGASEVDISDGESSVTYQRVDHMKLKGYILSLEAQVRAAGGTVDSARRTAIRPVFC